MGDQQDGSAHLRGERGHLVQHDPLHGHVECRGRLVGEEHLGPAGQRDGDEDALPHATGELVRVLVEACERVGDACVLEQSDRLRLGGLPAGSAVDLQRLDDLRADGHHGVEVGHRVLRDQSDAGATDRRHDLVAGRRDVQVTERDRARGDPPVVGEQPVHAGGEGGLAGAGLADDRDRLAGADLEVHAADRLDRAAGRREGDREVTDGEDRGVGRAHDSSTGVAGSDVACASASRAASSRRLSIAAVVSRPDRTDGSTSSGRGRRVP